jgi:hypothetical protein
MQVLLLLNESVGLSVFKPLINIEPRGHGFDTSRTLALSNWDRLEVHLCSKERWLRHKQTLNTAAVLGEVFAC